MKTKTKTETIYITSDGRRFNDLLEARQHNATLPRMTYESAVRRKGDALRPCGDAIEKSTDYNYIVKRLIELNDLYNDRWWMEYEDCHSPEEFTEKYLINPEDKFEDEYTFDILFELGSSYYFAFTSDEAIISFTL